MLWEALPGDGIVGTGTRSGPRLGRGVCFVVFVAVIEIQQFSVEVDLAFGF
jgi:hypothetical protein